MLLKPPFMETNKMQRTVLALLPLVTALAAGSAQGRCPVGGSENSVGTGRGAAYETLALEAFQASTEVEGQSRLLRDHGFCPVRVEIVTEQMDCDEQDQCDVFV